MTDPKNPRGVDLDLDWDEALAEIDRELAPVTGRVTPAPNPPSGSQALPNSSPAPRALYRPPTAEEVQQMRGRDSSPQEAPKSREVSVLDLAEEDDDGGRTVVGSLAALLQSSLTRSELPPPISARPTAPPPPPPAPVPSAPPSRGAELDFDDLLEGIENETTMYSPSMSKMLRDAAPLPPASPPTFQAPVDAGPKSPSTDRSTARPPPAAPTVRPPAPPEAMAPSAAPAPPPPPAVAAPTSDEAPSRDDLPTPGQALGGRPVPPPSARVRPGVPGKPPPVPVRAPSAARPPGLPPALRAAPPTGPLPTVPSAPAGRPGPLSVRAPGMPARPLPLPTRSIPPGGPKVPPPPPGKALAAAIAAKQAAAGTTPPLPALPVAPPPPSSPPTAEEAEIDQALALLDGALLDGALIDGALLEGALLEGDATDGATDAPTPAADSISNDSIANAPAKRVSDDADLVVGGATAALGPGSMPPPLPPRRSVAPPAAEPLPPAPDGEALADAPPLAASSTEDVFFLEPEEEVSRDSSHGQSTPEAMLATPSSADASPSVSLAIHADETASQPAIPAAPDPDPAAFEALSVEGSGGSEVPPSAELTSPLVPPDTASGPHADGALSTAPSAAVGALDAGAPLDLAAKAEGQDSTPSAGQGLAAAPDAPGAELEAAPVAPAPAAPDRGAIAARASVRSRKPRKELFPLVGRTSAHAAARADLLDALAKNAAGVRRARLLVSAAELRREAGQPSDAVGRRIDEAVAAAPQDPSVSWAARRFAAERQDGGRIMELFAGEAAGSSRLAALAMAGAAELGAPRTEEEASRLLEAARRLAGASASRTWALPLHASRIASGEAREREWLEAAERTTDAQLVRALTHLAAASALARRDGAAAEGASERLGAEGAWAHARAALAPSRAPGAGARLDAVAAAAPRGAFAEAVLRLAAQLDGGATRLDGVSGPAALRTRAALAQAAGQAEVEAQAQALLAERSGGTERARALVRLTELRVVLGDLEGAEEALRGAALSDPSHPGLRVARRRLATSDPTRVPTEAAEQEPAVTRAARAALGPLELERAALGDPDTERGAPLTTDVLGLDAAAEAGGEGAATMLAQALRRHAERLPVHGRKGALHALVELAGRTGQDEVAQAALDEALATWPRDAVMQGERARTADATGAVDAWQRAAEGGSPEVAAEHALRAARAAEALGGPDGAARALAAAKRAAELDAGSYKAWWAVSRLARAAADAPSLAAAETQLAALEAEPRAAAVHLVRAALARAEADPAEAGSLLARARGLAPDDLVLVALALRLGEGMPPRERADALERASVDAPPLLAAALRVAAAQAWEALGEPARVPALLRDAPAGPARQGLLRAQQALGLVDDLRAALELAVDTGPPEAKRQALRQRACIEADLGDAAAAERAHAALAALDPQDLDAVRGLERAAMAPGREDELAGVEERLVRLLVEPVDAAAHLRLLVRLAGRSSGEGADAHLLALADRSRPDLWSLRRLLAASLAAAEAERALGVALRIAERLARPEERVAMALRAAELVREAMPGAGDDAVAGRQIALLAPHAEETPTHPVLHRVLAEALEGRGEPSEVLEAWQRAAEAARVPAARARAFLRAGELAEEELGDEALAVGFYEQGALADPSDEELFSRAQRILERSGDTARLEALLARRLAAGGQAEGLVELQLAQAKAAATSGNTAAEREAYRAVLELAPEHPKALRRTAELSLAAGEPRAAAEALIRLARVRKDRDELRWVFFQLGDLYDAHLPDPKRAEAAWRRVLKLVPDDLPAMERLAALLVREGPKESAIPLLEELVRIEPDPDRVRGHRLSLARLFEDAGEARKAEQVLEAARRVAPTDLVPLRALVELYTRQRAQPALSMHLNRAVNDFRTALAADPSDEAAWLGLVEVLVWRGKTDAARVAASAAIALGLVDVELARLVDERGGVPPALRSLEDERVLEVLAPAPLTAPLRAVFRALSASLEKAMPFDPKALRAERLAASDVALRALVDDLVKTMGIDPPVEVWIAAGAPRSCAAVQSHPPAIVLGAELATAATEAEKRFLVARALEVARQGLALVGRITPSEVPLLLAALAAQADPNLSHALDAAQLEVWSQRIARALPRRWAEDNGPLLLEMAGAPEHDPSRLQRAIGELGSRAALLATGSVPDGLAALARAGAEGALPDGIAARAKFLTRSPEAAHLVEFAISDVHFELRARAGTERL